MRQTIITLTLLPLLLLSFIGEAFCGTGLVSRAGKDTVMVAVFAKQGAEDYTEYADGVLKERLKSLGFRIMDQQMSEKLKKDRLLLQAIKNANATALARISSDFGAGIVIRGTLQSVVSSDRLGSSWEGLASVSLAAIDTRTGEEIESVVSDPMGVADNPAPIEDASLSAKQMAIRKAIDSILSKMGASSEILSQVTSLSPRLHASFEEAGVSAAAFSPDSTLLATASETTIKLWEMGGKSLAKTLRVKRGAVMGLVFSPDGGKLAALSKNGKATIFTLPEGTAAAVIETDAEGKGAISFSPDGSLLASGGDDGYIRVWDVASGRRISEIRGHGERIHSLSFDAAGRTLISASDDLSIKFWDLGTRREIKAFQEPMDRLSIAALNGDRTVIAYSAKTVEIDLMRRRRTDKRFIRVRETATGRDLSTFEGHAKDITSLAFLPGKRFLVSGGDDGLVKIWDLEKRGEISTLEQRDRVSAVAVSRDGKWLCAASNEVVVWQLK